MRWAFFMKTLSQIKTNVKIEIHENIDSLMELNGFKHFNFTFDSVDDVGCGITDFFTLKQKYQCGNLLITSNGHDDIILHYSNDYIDITVSNLIQKLHVVGISCCFGIGLCLGKLIQLFIIRI